MDNAVVADASLWEIASKSSIGKLRTEPNLAATVRATRFERRAFANRYVETLSGVPLHHRDPFDRMLVAPALADDLVLVTSDPIRAKYGMRTVDARE